MWRLEARRSEPILRALIRDGRRGQCITTAASNRFEWTSAMDMGQARKLWKSQCDVAPTIRERYGLKSALDYLLAEKLLNFAEAAVTRPDFAQELPLFVAQVRRLFTQAVHTRGDQA